MRETIRRLLVRVADAPSHGVRLSSSPLTACTRSSRTPTGSELLNPTPRLVPSAAVLPTGKYDHFLSGEYRLLGPTGVSCSRRGEAAPRGDASMIGAASRVDRTSQPRACNDRNHTEPSAGFTSGATAAPATLV